jgi:hypothetical protein
MLGLPLELVVIIGMATLGLTVYYGRKMSLLARVSLPKNVPWRILLLLFVTVPIGFFSETINQESRELLGLPILKVVLNNYGWIGLFMVIVGISWEKLNWMKGVGGLLILFAVFFSGYADWAKSKVELASTELSCNADPAQAKCVQLQEQREAEAAHELEEQLSRVQQQARLEAAIQEARAAAKPEPTEAPPGEACGGDFAHLKGCESIVFGRNEKRDHEPPIGFCSVGDGPITGTSLGSAGMTRWTPNVENVRGRVFFLRAGESFGGFTCR